MKNCHELRTELAKVFESLRQGETEMKTAAELANIAGKIIASAKVQVEYYALTQAPCEIGFLEEEPAE